MEQEILRKVEENAKMLEAVYRSTEKIRKYFLWMLIIAIAFTVIPLIGLAFVIPSYLNTLNSLSNF